MKEILSFAAVTIQHNLYDIGMDDPIADTRVGRICAE